MDNEVIVAIIGFLGTALGYFVNELKQKKKGDVATQRALKILLRKEIKEFYESCESKGYITHLESREFNDILDVYNTLIGNNGYVENIEDKVKSLEVRK